MKGQPMKFRTILLAATMVIGCSPAFAWNNTINGKGQIVDGGPGAQSNAYSTSHAYSKSSSRSHSNSNATGGSANVTNINEGGIGGTGNSGGAGLIGITVPDLAGQASCSGSISLGGIGLSGGGSAGGMWEFHDCKVIREAQELNRLGMHEAAVNELCQQIDRIKKAMGGTCPNQAQPATQTVAESTGYPYDYCYTRNAGDKNQHKECDHPPVTTVRH